MPEFIHSIADFEPYLQRGPAHEPDTMAEFWDERADNFFASFKNKQDVEDTFVFSNLDKLGVISPGDTVLDIGCGVGRHANGFVARGAKYLGIDLSPRMIELANTTDLAVRSRATQSGAEGVPSVRFEVADWTQAQQHDIVFSNMVPAFDTVAAVTKYSRLAKKWAVMSRSLSETSPEIAELGLQENQAHNNPSYAYGLLNVLWHLGYRPSVITEKTSSPWQVSLDMFMDWHKQTVEEFPAEKQKAFYSTLDRITEDGKVTLHREMTWQLIAWQVG